MPGMPIGLTEEHEALRLALRRFVETRIPPSVTRAALDAERDAVPPFWSALCEPGWLGLHVDEGAGGAGFGFVEQTVVLEELGRAAAPGPYVPTVLATAVLQDAGGEVAEKLLPQLATGEARGAVALASGAAILGGMLADVLIVAGPDGAWYALDADGPEVQECKSVDPTRRLARVVLDDVPFPEDRRLTISAARVREIAAVILAAEAVGVAQWCVETAAEYAKVRVQFGRPIGQFQGVKHKCADMLARTELARAAAWDAARALQERDNGARVA